MCYYNPVRALTHLRCVTLDCWAGGRTDGWMDRPLTGHITTQSPVKLTLSHIIHHTSFNDISYTYIDADKVIHHTSSKISQLYPP